MDTLEASQNIHCDIDTGSWKNSPTKCITVEQACNLPNITNSTDSNVVEVTEFLVIEESDKTNLIGGTRKVARCKPGYVFNVTRKSSHILSCTCRLEEERYLCQKDIEVSSPGECVVDQELIPENTSKVPGENVGSDLAKDMISKIVGPNVPELGSLQHVLAIKGAKFSNFLNGLYQSYLHAILMKIYKQIIFIFCFIFKAIK